MDFAGKTVVVTGAASGIGKATAHTFASLGAHVIAGDINLPGCEDTANEIRSAGGNVTALRVDVTSPESIDAFARDALAAGGTPAAVVNTVGWDIIEPFVKNTPEYWDQIVNLNFMGPVRITRAFLDPMIEANSGAIVYVASDAGRVGSTGETVYAGAKGGVIAFTKSLAREMARHQIRVNCVCPGPTDTPLFRSQPEKMQEALEKAIPLRRLAKPEEVADAIAFFASNRASFITGQVLSVSGGLTMNG
jgi:2-hydroxycyclohexanecarboxyl-CoA dehydrogenase